MPKKKIEDWKPNPLSLISKRTCISVLQIQIFLDDIFEGHLITQASLVITLFPDVGIICIWVGEDDIPIIKHLLNLEQMLFTAEIPDGIFT